MKVTERSVASVGTISRALNNDIHVAPDARERVSIVISELGYVANLVKSMADGLLLILLGNPAGYIGTRTNTSFPLVLIDHKAPAAAVRLSARSMECWGKNLVWLIMPAIGYPFALEGIRAVNVLAESTF